MKAKNITSLILSLALSACVSANGPVYSTQALENVPHNKVRLVIYRPNAVMFVNKNPALEINNTQKCKIPNASYLNFILPPGQTIIAGDPSTSAGTARMTIKTKAGNTYFVKLTPDGGRAVGAAFGAIGTAIQDNAEGSSLFSFDQVDKITAEQDLNGEKQSIDCQ